MTIICPSCRRPRELLKAPKDPNAVCRSCASKPEVECARCHGTFRLKRGRKLCYTCFAAHRNPEKSCVVCAKPHFRRTDTCSRVCSLRERTNATYFGGQAYGDTVGWAEKVCQACGKSVPRGGHRHHVFADPGAGTTLLHLLCPGCHKTVSHWAQLLEHRSGPWLVQAVQKWLIYAAMQHSKRDGWIASVRLGEL